MRARSGGELRAVLAERSFAYPTYNTAALPFRLWADLDPGERPDPVRHQDDQFDFPSVRSPLEILLDGRATTGADVSAAAMLRLEATWLIAEDRYNLLDVGALEPLPHQLSLVEHVLGSSDLRRVLIADEVGLGKTIEAALILKRLVESPAGRELRVLYLTEARLVDNVATEFARTGLRFRRWSVEAQEATLAPDAHEGIVIASMHRAVASAIHTTTLEASGPWDVLIVDEAHHLTDWSEDGGDPLRRMRLVRRLLSDRLKPGGRLILLSGTPHQGHAERFKNLLKLLDDGLEDERASAGKVIYRIKEDIVGWEGEAIFPRRQVDAPVAVKVPPEYRRWLDEVTRLLEPGGGSRAGSWRQAQALEWCASSPEAGLAYLVRMALRCGITSRKFPPLRRALDAIRPYRGGASDEHHERLEARLLDNLEVGDERSTLDKRQLESVLDVGVGLVAADAIGQKVKTLLEWMEERRDEKFVIFAQPVDTVHLLHRRLESEFGRKSISLILGGQSPEERSSQIEHFKSRRGARALVSSRSGGEGINLQVSRNLVHFDVPWNPMDLEQRVGRVHRYGGFKTVHVRTLVVEGSREERVLQRCRARLGQAVRDLDSDRFERLFARTMSMVPLDELASLMMGENLGPLAQRDSDRLDNLVQEGFKRWQASDGALRAAAARLPELRRGTVRDDDLGAFLARVPGFKRVSGWTAAMAPPDSSGKPVHEPVQVFRLPDGATAMTRSPPGATVSGPEGTGEPRVVGLNDPSVCRAIREALFPSVACDVPASGLRLGAGAVSVSADVWTALVEAGLVKPPGGERLLLFAYLVTTYASESLLELGCRLACYLVDEGGRSEAALDGEASACLVRAIRSARPVQARAVQSAQAHLKREQVRLESLETAPAPGQMVAIFPIAAITIEAESKNGGLGNG